MSLRVANPVRTGLATLSSAAPPCSFLFWRFEKKITLVLMIENLEEIFLDSLPDEEVPLFLTINQVQSWHRELRGELYMQFVLENSFVYFLDLRINAEFANALRTLFINKKFELTATYKNEKVKIISIDFIKSDQLLGGLAVYIKKCS